MSQVLGKELTEGLLKRLNGEAIADKTGKAIVVVTVDDQGWAHPAMLSYFEVVAKDRATLDLAIGKSSTTAKNLKRTGKITLLITDRGVNFYIKGNAREIEESMAEVPFMSLFRVTLDQLLEDQEPDAMITSGVTFERPEKKEINAIVDKVFQGVRSVR
jgi:hypothetical protein